MNQIYPQVDHPVPLNTVVFAERPTCQCVGGKKEPVTGKVLKVIHNNTGYWYYLDSSVTIKGEWITKVRS